MTDNDKTAPTRRDFLYPVTAGVGLATVGLGAWSIFRATIPNQTLPVVTVDLTTVPEGAEITVRYLNRPIVIRHRTAAEIAAAEADDTAHLNDPLARNANLDPDAPATDKNRRATPDGRFIVFSKVCTHLGCVLTGNGAGNFNGLFCLCHSAHYDTAGRVRKGPAPRNLPVPAFSIWDGKILDLYAPGRTPPTVIDRLNSGI